MRPDVPLDGCAVMPQGLLSVGIKMQKGSVVMNLNRFDVVGKEARDRVEEIMNSTRLNDFLHRKEEEDRQKNCILWILAIIGVVTAVALIAYGVYRFFTPDYLEDFEDDFEDDFDDDFFEDEEKPAEKTE